MNLKIQVTLDDIRKGRKKSCHYCPIALAIRRLYPDKRIKVGSKVINFSNFDSTFTVWARMLPAIVSDFIARFDSDMKVIPFEFEIEKPIFDHE